MKQNLNYTDDTEQSVLCGEAILLWIMSKRVFTPLSLLRSFSRRLSSSELMVSVVTSVKFVSGARDGSGHKPVKMTFVNAFHL